jgi:hypothetical protein
MIPLENSSIEDGTTNSGTNFTVDDPSTTPPVTTTTTATITTNTGTSTSSSSTSSSPVLVNVSTCGDDDADDDDDSSNNNNNIAEEGSVKRDDMLLLLPVPQQQQVRVGNNNEMNVYSHATGTTTSHPKTATTERSKPIQQLLIYIYKQCIQTVQSSSSPSPSSIRNGNVSNTLTDSICQHMQWYTNFYIRFISIPSNQDKLFKLLQFTFYMCSITFTGESNFAKNNNDNASFSKWLHKLYNELTWARYILRSIQLPIAIDAAINHRWTIQATDTSTNTNMNTETETSSSPLVPPFSFFYLNDANQRQKVYNVLGTIMTYSMVMYYPTELLAYLLWMKPSSHVTNHDNQQSVQSSTPSSISTTLLFHPNQNNDLTTTSITTTMKQRLLLSYIRSLYNVTLQPTSSKEYQKQRHKLSFFSKIWKIPPETWSYLSCRCWLTYVITELIQSYIQYKELKIIEQNNGQLKMNTNDQKQQKQHLVLQCVRNLLFMIPCYTWSLSNWDTKPVVSLRTVNTLLWLESIVSLYQAIITQHNKDIDASNKNNNRISAIQPTQQIEEK